MNLKESRICVGDVKLGTLNDERKYVRKNELFNKLKIHALDKHKVYPEDKVRKHTKAFLEELKEKIKNGNWVGYSCGRSTDYVDEFWEETSIININEIITELAQKHFGGIVE